MQLWIFIVSGFDIAEESGADNAAAAPHQRDPAHVQMPSLFFRCFPQQHIALSVGDDLRAIQCPAHFLYKELTVM